MREILYLLVLMAMIVTSAFGASGPCVVEGRGHFTIHTGTSGFFSAFAHNHLVEAQRIEGCAVIDPQEVTRSSVKLNFTTANIKVVDPKENAETRGKVQKTMETEVLHVAEYPRVTFESTGVDRGTTVGQLRVHGNLTIKGMTQPITVPVTFNRLEDGTYRVTGEYRLKQTSFGIQPVQLAGGAVKVKDEISAEFELFLK